MSTLFGVETDPLKIADRLYGDYSTPARLRIPRKWLEDSSDDGLTDYDSDEEDDDHNGYDGEGKEDGDDSDDDVDDSGNVQPKLHHASGASAIPAPARAPAGTAMTQETVDNVKQSFADVTTALKSALYYDQVASSGTPSGLVQAQRIKGFIDEIANRVLDIMHEYSARDNEAAAKAVIVELTNFKQDMGSVPVKDRMQYVESFFQRLNHIKESHETEASRTARDLASSVPEPPEVVAAWQNERREQQAREALDRQYRLAAESVEKQQSAINKQRDEDDRILRIPSVKQLDQYIPVDPNPRNRMSLQDYEDEIADWYSGFKEILKERFANEYYSLPDDERDAEWKQYFARANQIWDHHKERAIETYADSLTRTTEIERSRKFLDREESDDEEAKGSQAEESQAEESQAEESQAEESQAEESQAEEEEEEDVQAKISDYTDRYSKLNFNELSQKAKALQEDDRLSAPKRIALLSRVVRELTKEAKQHQKQNPAKKILLIPSVRLNKDGTFSRLSAVVSSTKTIERIELQIDEMKKKIKPAKPVEKEKPQRKASKTKIPAPRSTTRKSPKPRSSKKKESTKRSDANR